MIEHLRLDERTRGIPVCVASADAATAPPGAVAVRKPFELAELRAGLRLALGCED